MFVFVFNRKSTSVEWGCCIKDRFSSRGSSFPESSIFRGNACNVMAFQEERNNSSSEGGGFVYAELESTMGFITCELHEIWEIFCPGSPADYKIHSKPTWGMIRNPEPKTIPKNPDTSLE